MIKRDQVGLTQTSSTSQVEPLTKVKLAKGELGLKYEKGSESLVM